MAKPSFFSRARLSVGKSSGPRPVAVAVETVPTAPVVAPATTGGAIPAVPTRIEDLADLSRALSAWQASENDRDRIFTLSVFALSGDMFAIAGFDGIFKTINPSWERVTGQSTAELTAEPYINFVHPDDRALTLAETAKLSAGADTISFRNRYRCKDQSYRWLNWTSVPAPEQKLIYVMARDITEEHNAEEAINKLNAELQERIAERDTYNKDLETFSYSVSHDLRAPLRAIDGFVRILVDEHGQEFEGEARRYLDLVAANAQQMGRLVDDLLKFSMMGRKPLTKQQVDTTAIARRAVEELKPNLAGRPVELTVADLPSVEADGALLYQVFLNLIGNAIKYTRGKDPARIEVGVRVDPNGEAVFFVRDNGAGFNMSYAHKLFGVFQRLHRSDEYEGTGVGLALVHRILAKHGGRIWPEAEVGKGATFFFTVGGTKAWHSTLAA